MLRFSPLSVALLLPLQQAAALLICSVGHAEISRASPSNLVVSLSAAGGAALVQEELDSFAALALEKWERVPCEPTQKARSIRNDPAGTFPVPYLQTRCGTDKPCHTCYGKENACCHDFARTAYEADPHKLPAYARDTIQGGQFRTTFFPNLDQAQIFHNHKIVQTVFGAFGPQLRPTTTDHQPAGSQCDGSSSKDRPEAASGASCYLHWPGHSMSVYFSAHGIPAHGMPGSNKTKTGGALLLMSWNNQFTSEWWLSPPPHTEAEKAESDKLDDEQKFAKKLGPSVKAFFHGWRDRCGRRKLIPYGMDLNEQDEVNNELKICLEFPWLWTPVSNQAERSSWRSLQTALLWQSNVEFRLGVYGRYWKKTEAAALRDRIEAEVQRREAEVQRRGFSEDQRQRMPGGGLLEAHGPGTGLAVCKRARDGGGQEGPLRRDSEALDQVYSEHGIPKEGDLPRSLPKPKPKPKEA